MTKDTAKRFSRKPLSMAMVWALAALSFMMISTSANATEVLVRLKGPQSLKSQSIAFFKSGGFEVEPLAAQWYKVETPFRMTQKAAMSFLAQAPGVDAVQPNYKVKLQHDFRIQDPVLRSMALKALEEQEAPVPPADNPEIPNVADQPVLHGSDPLMNQQWGLLDIGAPESWNVTKGRPEMVVAVIDTGVDYTHEDLAPNIWRNPGETGTDSQGRDKATNGVDDDGNGFIDDTIGWDFVSNDNKPYDLTVSVWEMIFGGGNPGHGTHCAGSIAAKSDNGIGIAGVAPNVKIMPVRFLSERGEGTTADAIKAVKYAVDNGAKVLSNSWGSEGEDPKEGTSNQALRDIVQYAQNKGVLFIAAAGNGHSGLGYDNDTDPKPGYPASYDHENIISVAAIDKNNELGTFSNWGVKSVDIGAPGVNVFSTMVKNRYSNKVIDFAGISVNWDGTSMATPFVSGAAALYWSAHPTATWRDVKNAILTSAIPVPALQNKVVSGGKLNVLRLMGN